MTALPDCCQRLPVMLAASSPVRIGRLCRSRHRSRRYYSFRGASGIDGTLSLALGLVLGPTLLISGDWPQHDSNGWLLASASVLPLVVLLIDNGGGGIFGQLPIPAHRLLRSINFLRCRNAASAGSGCRPWCARQADQLSG